MRRAGTCAALAFAGVTACTGAASRSTRDRGELPQIARPGAFPEWESGVRAAFDERHLSLERRIADPHATQEELAGAYGRLGMWLHAYKLSAAAELCYRTARELAPDETRWSYYLGRIYAAQGRNELAHASFRQVLETKPADVPTLVLLAEIQLTVGEDDDAHALLEAAIAERPDEIRAQARLGQLALARREYREAVGWLQAAGARAPDLGEIQYSLSMAYRGLGELEQARRHLSRADLSRSRPQLPLRDPLMVELAQLRDDAKTHDSLGQRAFREERYAAAAEEFRQAIAAAPDRPGPRQNLASALVKLGSLDEARGVLRDLLEVAPDFPEAHYYLGALLNEPETRDLAEQHLRKAVALDPQLKKAHRQLARLLEAEGRSEEALRHRERGQ